MELLNELFANAQLPIWSAFLLGLMTAISPCPLATNITAIGYLSKDIGDKKQVFLKGLVYTGGRALSYTLLGTIIYLGASQVNISAIFQGWGEKVLGPILIIIGLFMLGAIKIPGNKINNAIANMGQKGSKNYWGALLLGVLFALAFCPYSGVLYFGMLMPLTIGSSYGILLPVIFALATGLPVVIFAWLIAHALKNVGKIYNKIKAFETWMRRIVAALFILIGVYYCLIFYFNLNI